MVVPRDWRAEGLCASLEMDDPLWEQFFEDDAFDRRPARNFCGDCPVRLQCLRQALETPEIWGVWGGCDQDEIKRALWVDSTGEPAQRSRYPNCPACKARPNRLTVGLVCDLRSRRRRDRVTCRACGFWWDSSSSATGVRAYWRSRRRVSARSAARWRRVSDPPVVTRHPVAPGAWTGSADESIAAAGHVYNDVIS